SPRWCALNLVPPAPLWGAAGASAIVVLLAWRSGALSGSGALAAWLVGVAAMSQSWGCGAFLIIWFVLSSVLSRVGRHRKAERTLGMVAKGDRRDWSQVFANGAVFGVAAATLGLHATGWLPLAVAPEVIAIGGTSALVSAGADTWATELGTLVGGRPWSLRERRRVDVGSSGAITAVGTLATVVGAGTLSVIASMFDVIPRDAVLVVAVSGVVASAVDTLLGAWWQQRRWCPRCNTATEQMGHFCGTHTVLVGGLRALPNDAVNFACTASGAVLAMAIWLVRQP
ncbi:MAG: DUF92 domain-containing protein, partial [Gemmatimonas sp.]